MQYNLQGTTMQMLNIELDEGESIIAESGKMVYMSDNVKMETELKGGLWAGIKRAFAGESFFLLKFTSEAGKGLVAFGSEFPGKIIPIKLEENQEIIAQKDAFLCSEESATFDATFTKSIGAGFLGGEGLIMLKMKGPGYVFFNIPGEVTKIHLEEGQKLRIDAGSIAMFEGTVNYDVERITGIKNILFSGESIFLATLTGPGDVWIQSMTLPKLAMKLYQYMPHSHSTASGSLAGAAAGAAIGALFGRR